jgi:hypothetical protein
MGFTIDPEGDVRDIGCEDDVAQNRLIGTFLWWR